MEKKKDESVIRVLHEVCSEICDDYCKYSDKFAEMQEWEVRAVQENICSKCPLNRLE